MFASWKESCDKSRQQIKKQRYHFANKGLSFQSCSFTSTHLQMWELDSKEGWTPKSWCFRTVVLEKTLESVLNSKQINPVTPKGKQPWMFIGGINTEVNAPILWPPDLKSHIGKDPDARKVWRQEEKGTTEDEMVEWQHQLNGREFEKTLGDSEGQGSLVCCGPWVCK